MDISSKIKVKCINRENLIEPQGNVILTLGKFYDLLEVETDQNSAAIYWIIDDTGTKTFYDGMRFDPNPVALRRLMRLGELVISE